MADDLKPSNLDFGVIIAFVAPGFVAFVAASYHLPTAGTWMASAANKDQSVGVFLFVLLGSLSLGLVVSGVRALVIDKLLQCRLLGRFVVPELSLDWSCVNETNLALLVTIRDNHYRYYQFYSNTLIAALIWIFARSSSVAPPLNWVFWPLIIGVLVALFLSSREAWLRYVKGVQQVLSVRL